MPLHRMRKTLMLTAAVPAAVIFFLLATLPPRPLTAPVGDASLTRRTVAGAYHVHTVRSDGAADRAEVAAAAARAGLQFLILTDHGDATRAPDPPEYLHGVLVVDAVEVSTRGGHYVAMGLREASPYPLGGEPSAVIEDVTRMGGFGVAAHPDSPKSELAWTGWSARPDGIEWLSADTEWRNETRARLVRALADYLIRPAPALASILDRPVETLARWDRLTADRRVTAIAGHDAHGGVGRGAEDRRPGGRAWWRPDVPSYEASFRTFSTRVVLDQAPTGRASEDAATLLEAMREGRMFTSIDALAAPAVFDFRAVRGDVAAQMGGVIGPGPAVLTVKGSVPPGGRIVLLRNGTEVASADGGTLEMPTPEAEGAYRFEVRLPNAPGESAVPWVLGNPIYFLRAPPPAPAPREVALEPLPSGVSWHVEKDRGSTGSVVHGAGEVSFFYKLRGPGRGSQYAAAVADLQGRVPAATEIGFSATSVRPSRLSVQLRYRRGGGVRWRQSVYVDATPRAIRVPVAAMLPADRQSGPPPDGAAAMSLLFVVDLTNALPGAANTVRISGVGFGRQK